MRNFPGGNLGDLGLDASGSFTRGASIANQIIDNRLRRENQEQNYDIQGRELQLREQKAQQEQQQQQVMQQLGKEAFENPDIVLPQIYARDPQAGALISEGIQQRYSQQYNTLSLLTKDTKAENKQATYELVRPELEKQFPELEFGDKYSSELNNSLKARASAIKAKMKTNLEFRDTGQGITAFNPRTGEGVSTGFSSKKDTSNRPAVLQVADELFRASGGKISKQNAIMMAGKYLNKENVINAETGNVEKLGGALTATKETKQAEKLGTDLGEAQAKAQANLGQMEDNSSFLLSQLDAIKNHPGKKGAVGLKGGGASFGNIGSDKIIPGTPEADFVARMNQIEGQAFLQAFDTLRGGGQITETEGKKATEARLRMSRATSEKEFDEANDEFVDIVKTGLERQRRQAKGDFGSQIKSDKKQDFGGFKLIRVRDK